MRPLTSFVWQITDASTGKLLVSGSHTKVDTFTRNKGKL